jgi:ribosome biogenesis protein UTP30
MTCQQLTENILEIAKGSVPHMPLKWANIQNIAIKTPESVALPIYNKTPDVLREIAVAAGVDKDAAKTEIDTPEKEPEETPLSSKESPKSDKKRDMKSPLLRALKKQKQEETKAKKPVKEETPKEKKKGPSSTSDADTSAKKIESVKDDNKPTPKSNKKASSKEEAIKFISAKKFNGSKKGYVFRMGKEGLGYYVDVKPKVDHMAMEALMRAGKNNKGRDAPNKGRKGRKSW